MCLIYMTVILVQSQETCGTGGQTGGIYGEELKGIVVIVMCQYDNWLT